MRIMRAISSCVLLGTLILRASASDQRGSTSLSSLPVAAQASISAALGREKSQYHLRAAGRGFEAITPLQRLDTRFTAQGVEVSSGTVRWSMALQGYGYGEALKAVEVVTPEGNLNRVEYRRGSVREWYVNGPMGLEQGFTLSERPGQLNGRPLTFALMLRGNVLASVNEDGKSLKLVDSTGRALLRYAGLAAQDATGTQLHTWLEIRDERLLLRVEDKDARYPVTVDPLVQLAELTASDGAANSFFGFQCAISGNTVVVTSFSSPSFSFHGAAYVFVKPSSGWANMTQTAELTSSNGAANDYFGDAVGISGNTVVVGALGVTVGGNAGQGAAYVFVEPAGGWANMTETAMLTAKDGMAKDGFGESIAINGGTIVIGADGATVNGNGGQGAAYVYNRPAGGWKTTDAFKAKLTSSDGQAYDGFGGDVAISGNTIVSGAPQYPPSTGSGAAYVFVEPPHGWVTGTQNAKLTASDGATDALLGSTLDISGNTIVAGAYNATVHSHASQGAAYVFVKPAGGWANATQTAKLTAADGKANDSFSSGISINANTIFLGSPAAKIGSNSQQGAVYQFVKPASGWKTTSRYTKKFTASDGVAGAEFGFCVAARRNTFVAGAILQTVGSTAQGTAYVFGPR
jgi:hypothetical protein